MSIFIALLLIVLVFWLAGAWLIRSENLGVYQHPVDPVASESFSSPAGTSLEHQQAAAGIKAMGSKVSGMSLRKRLLYTREFMESFSVGREFSCDFIPVDADGVKGEWVLAPGAEASRRVLYIHGGAFFAGSPNSHRTITSRFSAVTGAAVLAIDYRLMPEHQRRAGVEDCRTAYRWILNHGPEGSVPLSRLYVSGDSAGGNLSLMLAPWVRDAGLRAADAVIALSPLTDATYSGSSIRKNMHTDIMLGPMFRKLLKIPRAILGWIFLLENRIRSSDPVVSPIFSDLSNLPPILIQVSESEMLLDDAVRYVNKARACGTPAQIQTWAGMLHVWQIFNPEVPEAVEAFEQIAKFVRSVESG